MDLQQYSMFLLLTTSAMAMTEEMGFVRSNALENKYVSFGVLSTCMKTSAAECAGQCLRLTCCQSFFFNIFTGECQFHNDVFTSTVDAAEQDGQCYYYITEESIIRCPVSSVSCPTEKGFQLLEDDTTCVKFHSDQKTWCDASRICKSYTPNSRLVVVDNQQKNEVVKRAGLAINDQFVLPLWMGISEYTQNEYRWMDGSEVNFTDWDAKDFSDPNEKNCGVYQRNVAWRWTRWRCTKLHHYICETWTEK